MFHFSFCSLVHNFIYIMILIGLKLPAKRKYNHKLSRQSNKGHDRYDGIYFCCLLAEEVMVFEAVGNNLNTIIWICFDLNHRKSEQQKLSWYNKCFKTNC